jgi:hypothetical protein
MYAHANQEERFLRLRWHCFVCPVVPWSLDNGVVPVSNNNVSGSFQTMEPGFASGRERFQSFSTAVHEDVRFSEAVSQDQSHDKTCMPQAL